MKAIGLVELAFVVLAGISIPSHAQVIVFDSFGPGNTYGGVVWGVSGAASAAPGYRGQAEFFTPAVSGDLDSIEVATYHVSGSDLSDFYIAQDNGSGILGANLESFLNVQNVDGLLTLDSTPDVLLQAGTEYWLCDVPAASTSYNGWYQNDQGQANGFAYERSPSGWMSASGADSGVFEITVTCFPDKAWTMELGIMSGCCILLFRGRKEHLVFPLKIWSSLHKHTI